MNVDSDSVAKYLSAFQNNVVKCVLRSDLYFVFKNSYNLQLFTFLWPKNVSQ